MKLLPSSRPTLLASHIASPLRGPSCSAPTSRVTPVQSNQSIQSRWHTRRTLAHSATSATPHQTTNEPARQSSTLTLTDQVRLLMRRVPYPVSIITATDPTARNNPPELSFRGMTVSSFNTVTLTPEPVISFNVKRPSETLSALRSSRRFLAHLLAPNTATATLARDFSKGNHNLTILDGKGEFEFVGHGAGDGDLLPVLRRRGKADDGAEDFPFVFECRLKEQEVEVHDHTIVLGTIVRTLVGGSVDGGKVSEGDRGFCLTYADTRFWGMGRQI